MSQQDLPAKVYLRDLSVDERAELGYDLFLENAKGKSVSALARDHGLNRESAQTLINEHAAFERATGGDSKMANIAVYKFILEKATEIMENPQGHPALLQAKSFEAAIQAATRLDKLGGHEAPTMHGEIPQDTIRDMMERAQASGDFDDISPMDQGKVYREDEVIEDAEVIYEEDA
jgi:hypothetical protein